MGNHMTVHEERCQMAQNNATQPDDLEFVVDPKNTAGKRAWGVGDLENIRIIIQRLGSDGEYVDVQGQKAFEGLGPHVFKSPSPGEYLLQVKYTTKVRVADGSGSSEQGREKEARGIGELSFTVPEHYLRTWTKTGLKWLCGGGVIYGLWNYFG